MRNRFLAIGNHKLVEVGIGADDGRLPDVVGECDVIGGSAEFNVVAEEFCEFCISCPMVHQPHTVGQQAKARQLPTNPHQCRHRAFDLLRIQMATDANTVQRYPTDLPSMHFSEIPSLTMEL